MLTLPIYHGISHVELQLNKAGWWFQPHWKILGQNGNLPQVRVKINNIWNHYLERIWETGNSYASVFSRRFHQPRVQFFPVPWHLLQAPGVTGNPNKGSKDTPPLPLHCSHSRTLDLKGAQVSLWFVRYQQKLFAEAQPPTCQTQWNIGPMKQCNCS